MSTEPFASIRAGRGVTLFPATCPACHHRFSTPVLSDFDYGEFLLRGERGKAVVYLPALLEPAWDVIAALCPGPHMTPEGYPDTDRLHWVIAQLADPVDGERFQMNRLCPDCRSIVINYTASMPLGVMHVPAASYRGFMSRPPEEQKALVLERSDAYIRERGR